MPLPKPRPATYADIEALPPNMVGEILFDQLHVQPRPAPRHGFATTILASALTGRFGKGGPAPADWLFMIEPELHLGPHTIVPDIAAWRRERMPKLPKTAYIETSPDWVAEVLSPSTQKIDRTAKLAIYAAFSVSHAWYVDPIEQTLEVFALGADRRWTIAATFQDADSVTAPPFEAGTFALDDLWAEVET